MKSLLKYFIKNKNGSMKSPFFKLGIKVGIGSILFIAIIIIIITVIFGPIMLARQYIDEFSEGASLFFEKVGNVLSLNGWCADSDGSCQKRAEQKYYEELNDTYNSYQSKNVEIDVELITATIFYGYETDSYLYQVDENGINQNFIKRYCDANHIGWIGENTCELYVESNYESVYAENGERYLKIASNYDDLKNSLCINNKTLISSLPLNTIMPLTGVIDKTVEESCEYYLWNYADLDNISYNSNTMEILYENGKDEIDTLAKNMVSGSSLDYDKYRTYLEQTYIPKRFSDMYTPENEEKAVKKIADEIMAFASKKASGSNTGGSCVVYSCNTVFLTGEYAGEYSLEDYVKGVVNAESGGFKGYTDNYKEEWKAQAITARSMVLNNYDICTESVPNSTNFQAFKPGWSEEISQAVDETAGMVLTDNDEVYLAQYDAFFEGTGSDFHCDGELCYSTYYRRGSGNDPSNWEKHTIKTYSKYQSSFAPYPNGHGIGMSQWGAAYMADTGSKYDEILNFYYADNIKISKVGNSCSTNTSGYDWRQGDPQWASRSYGGATLGAVGCNFTSIVIEIARSGKQTVLPELNPGTAFDFMKARGYLGYGGDTLSYAAFSDLAPDFIHEGSAYPGSLDQAYQELVKLLDANKYPIVHVMSGNGLPYATSNHWVAVVGYTSDDIEIVDPANTGCTRLFTCKPGLDRSNGYGVVDTIQYWR